MVYHKKVNPNLPTSENQEIKPVALKQKLPLVLLVLIVIVLIVASGVFYFWKLKPASKTQNTPPVALNKQIIAKVGEELIYQKDLDTEMSYYPKVKPVKQAETRKFLLEKIATDSAILQGAKADGFISLDSSVFNAPNKDYLKRIKLVEQAKKAVADQTDGIEGMVVSIWFYNIKPGAVGYTKGKEIAYQKITKLQEDVKSKKMTIQQAAAQIRNDASLVQVDPSYKSNALFAFKAGRNQKISFSPQFNALLWKLQEGDISDVFLAQDREKPSGDKKIDAVYMFGTVTKRISTGKITDFISWLSQKERIYVATYY